MAGDGLESAQYNRSARLSTARARRRPHAADARQLRQLHLEPRPVPGRARCRRSRSCATTRSRSTRSRRCIPIRSSFRRGPARRPRRASRVPLIRRFAGKIPILGVCLGHQAIGQAFGGAGHPRAARDARQAVVDRPRPARRVRRRAVAVQRDALPFARDRARERCPPCSTSPRRPTTARSWRVRHRELPVEGVQFHPEAILTEHGRKVLRELSRRDRLKAREFIERAGRCDSPSGTAPTGFAAYRSWPSRFRTRCSARSSIARSSTTRCCR